MDWRYEWWWVVLLAISWVGLFIAGSPRSLKSYYSAGIWSMVLAGACEYVIRRPWDFWETAHTLAAIGGVELALLIGPRFVEGVLFFQFMPKQTSLQLPAVIFWTTQAALTDLGAVLTRNAHWSWPGLAAGLMLHMFRFGMLIAIFYGLAYEKRAERLGIIARQEKMHRWGTAAWKLSWIPLYFGLRTMVALMDRAAARAARRL